MKDDFRTVEALEKFASDMQAMSVLLDQANLTFVDYIRMKDEGKINLSDKEKEFLTDWIGQYNLAKERFFKKLHNISIH